MFGLKAKIFGGTSCAYRQEIGGTRGAHNDTNTTGLGSGLVAGTLVATAMGWRPVECLIQGDLVLTFDGGMQPVRAVKKGLHWNGPQSCPKALLPLQIPAGALGNQIQMTLLPEQCTMLESDAADMLFGDPFTLLKAAELDGFRGIMRAIPDTHLEVVQLQFNDDEVVFANFGALVFCPSLKVVNVAELLEARPDAMRYDRLSTDTAKLLVECLMDEDSVSFPEPMQMAATA